MPLLLYCWDSSRKPKIPFLRVSWHNRNMRRRSSMGDDFQNALNVVEQAIGAPLKAPSKRPLQFPVRKKNPAAVALGKLGGSKGGRARAAKLSPEKRTAIAQRAAQARWTKAKKGL